MNFQQFAEANGLIINHIIEGRWIRVPTVDKPNKKNGAYIFDGKSGAVRNWAVHDKAVVWQSDEPFRPDPQWKAKKEKAEQDRKRKQFDAYKKAKWIISNSVKDHHPYLIRKGFDDVKGWVWQGMLIVPMRYADGKLVGCQMIAEDGTKKFLSGQATSDARATIDAKGQHFVCEGYATALSVRRVMKYLGKRYTIHVAFSASNILKVAEGMDCIVIADNDVVGIKTAKKTGKPYWLSDVEGEDFNDAEKRIGTEALSLSLLKLIK